MVSSSACAVIFHGDLFIVIPLCVHGHRHDGNWGAAYFQQTTICAEKPKIENLAIEGPELREHFYCQAIRHFSEHHARHVAEKNRLGSSRESASARAEIDRIPEK